MEEKYQIWIQTKADGSEYMIMLPSDQSYLIQDEADHMLREFSAISPERALESFRNWRESHWDDDLSIEE